MVPRVFLVGLVHPPLTLLYRIGVTIMLALWCPSRRLVAVLYFESEVTINGAHNTVRQYDLFVCKLAVEAFLAESLAGGENFAHFDVDLADDLLVTVIVEPDQ